MENQLIKISIIIPVYNEEKIIESVINNLEKDLRQLNIEYEIITVNDGSSDNSRNILEKISGIKIINHPYNKGYGASLKTGAKNAEYDWLLFFDADGQHKGEYIKEFIKYTAEYDMIIGARCGYQGPSWRQPGKKLLNWLAIYLVDFKIPDLNSGLRLVKKDLFEKFSHLYPDKFSLSTTITLCFIKEGLNVKYIPITINKRIGQSTVKIGHGFDAILLIIRMITLFSPMKFFAPFIVFLFGLMATSLIIDLKTQGLNLSDSSVILILSIIIIIFLGFILDHLAAIRREIKIIK